MGKVNSEELNARRIAMLETQLAATIGVLSCLMKLVPRDQLLEFHKRCNLMLETTHAGLLGDGGRHSEERIAAIEIFEKIVFGDANLDRHDQRDIDR